MGLQSGHGCGDGGVQVLRVGGQPALGGERGGVVGGFGRGGDDAGVAQNAVHRLVTFSHAELVVQFHVVALEGALGGFAGLAHEGEQCLDELLLGQGEGADVALLAGALAVLVADIGDECDGVGQVRRLEAQVQGRCVGGVQGRAGDGVARAQQGDHRAFEFSIAHISVLRIRCLVCMKPPFG